MLGEVWKWGYTVDANSWRTTGDIWAHFDGIIARNYWNEIKNATASLICESTEISQQMAKLYSYGSTNLSSSEATTSNLLAAILQHYLQSPAERTSDKTNTSIQNIRAFIDANFDQELSLDMNTLCFEYLHSLDIRTIY